MVTSVEIWNALSVSQFLAALGTASFDTDLIEELKADGRCLGDLSENELNGLVGDSTVALDRARNRLTQLLDISIRMGLLSAVVPVGPRAAWSISTSGVSTYALCEEASYEHPESLMGKETTEGGSEQQEDGVTSKSFDLTTAQGMLKITLLPINCQLDSH